MQSMHTSHNPLPLWDTNLAKDLSMFISIPVSKALVAVELMELMFFYKSKHESC